MTFTMSERFLINFFCKQKNVIYMYMYLAPWNGFKDTSYT